MNPKPLLRQALACAALATWSGVCQASLSFSWTLLDWNPTVTSTESVLLRAQIYNNPFSSETLRGNRLLSHGGEGIEDAYSFADTLPSLATQLQALELDPGEGFAFVLGQLLPVHGSVAPGRYFSGGFEMSFLDDAGTTWSWSPDRTLVINVREADGNGGGHTVPEPCHAGAAANGCGRGLAGATPPPTPQPVRSEHPKTKRLLVWSSILIDSAHRRSDLPVQRGQAQKLGRVIAVRVNVLARRNADSERRENVERLLREVARVQSD